MKLTVLFFGATADAAGKRSLEIDMADGSDSRTAFERVLADHPALASHKLLFAVNQQYVSGDQIIKNGDELAIFTAVSGG